MGTSTRILAVAFVAVVAAFIGSTILVQRESRVIDADATLISRDAAPGIQVISNLRVELREMQTRALRRALLVRAGRGVTRGSAAAARALLRPAPRLTPRPAHIPSRS